MTSPTLSTPHPRRPPAHHSVSLRHSHSRRPPPPAKDQSHPSSDGAAHTGSMLGQWSRSNSPSSLQPLGRGSSGESSNAEKWFEQSNNQVRDNSTSFVNDPPFFMRHSSSEDTSPDAQPQAKPALQRHESAQSLPYRAGLMQLATDGSSTDDFRGVIDDLTIENKKLKRRLKKYEKLHDSHLRDEKLFEVRIHGLPTDKKHELEETLRKFAASLGTSAFPANGYQGLHTVLNKHHPASSHASLQRTDSAYASMSASGRGGSAGHVGTEKQYRVLGSDAASRQRNIQSYLHHIPEGSLPQSIRANMSERTKKRLVVLRLEQIFAGKGAAVGGHQHSLQQEDVSQMAARADRAASEAQGRESCQEGGREAQIMSRKSHKPAAPLRQADSNTSADDEPLNTPCELTAERHGKKTSTIQGSHPPIEQRPTRPLDLDPHRAQVPKENIMYMRHLGFSPRDPDSEQSPEEGHGWVYLNLLINMAQLHTINVTTEFVQTALTEQSSRFELSDDGRKVRWKGGRGLTRTSSIGEYSSGHGGLETLDGQSPRKRARLSSQRKSVSTLRRQARENNKLAYTPLFFHRDSTDDTDESEDGYDDAMSSPHRAPVAGDSSGMTSSGIRTALSRARPPRNHDEGPIIFYNNVPFCTDLSGDRKLEANTNAPLYTVAPSQPIGQPIIHAQDMAYEKRGPLTETSSLPEPMALADNRISETLELSFPQQSPLRSNNRKRALDHAEMEVTGIGGVWPADHFNITVESWRALVDPGVAPSVPINAPSKSLPLKFARMFQETEPDQRTRGAAHVQNKIVAAIKQDLPPSRLPPALGFMSEDSCDEDESDFEDDMSVSPDSPGMMPPSVAPQPVELHHASSDEDEDNEDDDDDDYESEGSLDLLAAAREIDPEKIREQEREYDANMAERLAEEIPAGSSAATAGGGSGFASPVQGGAMNREEYQRIVREARLKSLAKLNGKTGGGVSKVQKPRQSSLSEDEEMDDAAS